MNRRIKIFMDIIKPSAVIDKLIDQVLDGLSLRKALISVGITAFQLDQILSRDREMALRVARAMEMRSELLADQILEIADEDPDPNRARNRIQARQWLASKLHPKKYGERIDLSVTHSIDVAAVLAEATQRMRLVSDPADVIDAQIIESVEQLPSGSLDKESVVHVPTDAPDIFS
jgi:hypothetical protein